MNRIRMTMALLSLAVLAGCATGPGGEDFSGEISLPSLARDHGMDYHFDPVARQGIVTGPGTELVATPGNRVLLANNRTLVMDSPARLVQGEVWITKRTLQLYPGIFPPADAAAPAPRKPAPRTEVAVRTEPRRPSPAGRLLVLDAGHGGKDPGCSAQGAIEKEIVLDICRRAEKHLAGRGIRVVLTRDEDFFVELDDRADAAQRSGADLFMSVHANANPSSGIRGFETYYKSNLDDGAKLVTESTRLARAIQEALDRALDLPGRGIKENRRELRVLKKNTVPAVLVEVGFVTNREDRALLLTPDFRESVARALAEGVESYCGTR
ncbi:MAG: N-acetylmuramoyl-L-alanine amidase [Planctomycetes bacterium]|nr:N-acetylmuramoyl-L-alanine amidase [Planctomycetota bacterium]